MKQKRLLAVFAHPDDESFGPGGTLALCVREGVEVHLVCATRGDVGSSDSVDLGACADLACRREEELRCAAGVLGLAGVHLLGYRDSGMAGAEANQHPQALVQADPQFLAGQVAAWMCELRPQVVLTFDPFGGYGHPDHIAIHRATLRAFERVRAGLLPPGEAPQRLYYALMPRTLIRLAVRLLPLFGRDPAALGKNRDINLRDVLAHELPITTRVNIRRVYDVREQAAACHSSQISGSASIFGWLPRPLLRWVRGTEVFHRAVPPFGKGERLERGLFERVG